MLPGLGLLLLVVFIWVAAAELIQDLETTVGAFFLTYFSAGLFALWLPVVFCRARYTRSCDTKSRQRYELLPQREDVANAGDAKGQREGVRGNEVDAEDSSFVSTGFASATNLAECAHMLKLGLLFGPLWFFANWTYNASLELTSVASVTILSATSSSWCLVGAFLTGKERLLPPTPNIIIKCAAVALNLVGVAVVALADEAPGVDPGHGAEDGTPEASGNADGVDAERTQAEHSVLGDTVAIGSALCYAAYTTMLEQKLGDDADADMLSLFAFLGLCVLVIMAPVGAIAVLLDIEPSPVIPPWPVVRLLVLNGVAGTFLSQLLWARSVLLTSPLVATCGLSLTIPVAMVADLVLRGQAFGAVYLAGSICVVGGFVLVAVADSLAAKIER